jgi:hypothetical protein
LRKVGDEPGVLLDLVTLIWAKDCRQLSRRRDHTLTAHVLIAVVEDLGVI